MSIFSGGLLKELKFILKQNNIKPKKRLGQSFVVCQNLISSMIKAADIRNTDVVLEVGAGLGFLTRELAKKAKRVIAIEIDGKLIRILEKNLEKYGNVDIIHGDALKFKFDNAIDKIVSNLPFNISSQFTFKLVDFKFKYAILTLQREFVNRMMANPNSKDYGRLTVTSQFFFKIELLHHVPRKCFYPIPEVDASLVKLTPLRTSPLSNVDAFFLDIIKFLFSQKNKKLKNVLRNYFELNDVSNKKMILLDKIPFLERRIIELGVDELYKIALSIYPHLKSFHNRMIT
ncbi:MAG: 16S rRNA (adenine(1518)-N(6)/adenine(1519)-N(6))-dimethyltransferase RsmA [Candidatus Methanomethylicia archaeon]